MKSRNVFGVAPAVGFSVLPTLTCPACLPALASALGAVGLTFIAEPRYLVWLNLAALVVALFLLARSERAWISAPLGLALAGAVAVMLGKFVWMNSWGWWSGLGAFTFGSLWSASRRRSKIVCDNCETVAMED
jgi:mercuric ion transport protein